jgi:predicted nucleotide-binding protein
VSPTAGPYRLAWAGAHIAACRGTGGNLRRSLAYDQANFCDRFFKTRTILAYTVKFMPTRKQPPTPPAEPRLTMPRGTLQKALMDRIEKGRALHDLPVSNTTDLETFDSNVTKWRDFNHNLLEQAFGSPHFAQMFDGRSRGPIILNASSQERYHNRLIGLRGGITALESVLEQLELFAEPPSAPQPARSAERARGQSSRVFVVHGRDQAMESKVARFIEKLDLQPIILHEQPTEGRTIIEKIEQHSDVGFAVVLLTGDDVGALKETADQLTSRARQNVILELGYFIGFLGRRRVCALYEKGVELPSDFLGIGYVVIDEGGAWQFTLAREMKAVGLEVDLNRAM